ncbi:MAG TPA: prepilin-type N-terminal cleavage/methylation domain-containing protein [Gemmatimonadaceae bacterium]
MVTSFAGSRRAGFTLIETIVTIALLAVIAAFVIPSVIQKAGAGDLVKVQSDVKAIERSLETFAADSKGGLPRLVVSLTARPTTATQLIDASRTGTLNMVPGQVTAWNGPYLPATTTLAQKDSIGTGFLAFIMNHLVRYDATTDAPELDANFVQPVGTTFNNANALFAAVQIHGLTLMQAQRLNTLIDGTGEIAEATNGVGRFRYNTVSGVFTAYYLATAITQH